MNLKITAQSIYNELSARGIDIQIMRLARTQALVFDYAGKPRVIIGANPDASSASASVIAQAKHLTYEMVKRYNTAKMPATELYIDDTQAKKFLQQYKQVVIKPVDGAHGDGVTTNIVNTDQLGEAVVTARKCSGSGTVMIQQQVSGVDLRVLVIDGECISVVKREPARVIGDGVHTIAELVVIENMHNEDRGDLPYTKKLNKIDENAVKRYLSHQDIKRIPEKDEVCFVVGTANIGTGGRSIECHNAIPQEIINEAIAVTDLAGAFICGVDFLYDETQCSWYLIEINASPSFGLHLMPSEGRAITDLPKIYADKLLDRYNQG